MDKRNGKHFPRTDAMAAGDSHLPDEVLLLAVDGELSAHDAARVREHLEACWSCRVRRDEIEGSIGRVVEYSNSMVRPHLPLSAAARAMFLANLRNTIDRGRRPSLWERFTGLFHAFAIASRRPAWIAAGALACIVLLLFAEFRSTQVVSAGEVIRKSQESEKNLLLSVPRPVVYQKLRIEYSGQSVSRKLYLTPNQEHELESSNGKEVVVGREAMPSPSVKGNSTDARDCVKAAFEGAGLNWNNPLSAGAFEEWEDANPDRVDQIDRPTNGLTSIRSTPRRGAVSEIVVTFRTRDFHPIYEKVLLHDAGEINVIEDEFEVFSLDAVNPTLFALSGNTPLQPIASKLVVAAPASAPTFEQLQETELRARMALHAAGADLGDQIEVKQGEHNVVLVQGIANSPERKEEIEAELLGVGNVQARLATPQDTGGETAHSDSTAAETAIVVVEDQPLLQAELKEKFPDVDERKQFVDSTLEASQSAMAHVWALRRLAQRYAPEQIARLTPASRQILELLIRDHVDAIRDDVETESNLLQEVLTPPDTVSAPPQRLEGLSSDWRQATEGLFHSLESAEHDTSILFAGSQNSQAVELTTEELQSIVSGLKTQLPCFYENVSGNFLLKYHAAGQ